VAFVPVHLTWLGEMGELFQRRWWSYILLCLADGPKAFAELRQIINDQADLPISDAVLYRNLNELADAGLTEPPEQEGPDRGRWTLTADADHVVHKLGRVKRALDLVSASEIGGAIMAAGAASGPASRSDGAVVNSRESRPDWAPADVDITRPSVARIYDCYLGGHHNFAADRAVAEQSLKLLPETALRARAHRAFLGRAVRFLISQGVRQFLDIGSGIPTVGKVHEIVDHAGVVAPVVYVDIDPVAVAHAKQMLATHPTARVLQADARHPEAILDHPDVRIFDFNKPIGLLMVALLHAIPDDDNPVGVVRAFRDRLAPGSFVVISHVTADSQPELRGISDSLSQQTTTPITTRTRDQVMEFFDGFDLVQPGLVWGPLWRPEAADPQIAPEHSWSYVGVARLPRPQQ
jgi:DNA-binding HxlR family transcriptional regulator